MSYSTAAKFLTPLYLLWFAVAGAVAAAPDEPYRHMVSTVLLEMQDTYTASRRFSGRAMSPQRANAGLELPGKVASVQVEAGQQVLAGQELLALDSRLVDTDIRRAQSALDEMDAGLERLAADIRREKQLRAKGLSVGQRMDHLRSEYRAARAKREGLLAQVDALKLQLEKSRLVADFDAEVLAVHVEVGEAIKEGTPAVTLLRRGAREAHFGIPQQMASSLVPGKPVEVSGAFGRVRAEVLTVNAAVNTSTLNFSVRVQLPEAIEPADGSIVYMYFDELRAQRGAWLPLDALVADIRGSWVVYALNTENTLVKHAVVPVYQEDGRVFVETWLDHGSEVVSAGVHRLAPGQRVKTAGP